MKSELKTIAIVDDSEEVLSAFKRRFFKEYNILTFQTANDFMSSWDTIQAHLFIIDWKIPGTDGLTLCSKLRKHPRFKIASIAFFTGMDPTAENLEKAFLAGADSFLCKGHSDPFLMVQIEALIQSQERISRFLTQRETMISVLKHEMASYLTGVCTSVEVLGMDPIFKDPKLKEQIDLIMNASAGLQNLFFDLNVVLRGAQTEEFLTKNIPIHELKKEVSNYLDELERTFE